MKWVLGQSIYNVDSNTIINGENPIVSILNLNPLNRRKNWIAELEWNVSR